jgi:hypothetical protein
MHTPCPTCRRSVCPRSRCAACRGRPLRRSLGSPAGEAHLDALGIEREHHRRIATEGALLGGLIEKGFALDLAIISGGTRSDLGKRCRDGFASLKKTCRKLGISFWDYLGDRIGRHGHIAPLPDIIRERAAAASTVP